jgi:murein DD-endopeptidase MepM/ murein hydrolase activator NlpD
MMAAEGTPNVATVSGTIKQQQGALQGNGVFLSGDDGNSYWYFHLSRYEGSPRHVGQGEVIGYTGHTGNADGGAPHTHFEYHPGGGAAIDPYPLVRAAC